MPFLTAHWKDLNMANYLVDPGVLSPYLPSHTELDTFKGKIFVSLVGFMFCDTRVLGMKIPFHVHFEEVNLRFYVRYKDGDIWKRGTVFINEIVPKPAISLVANKIYHEKYRTHPMRHFRKGTEEANHLGYHWKHRGRWNRIEAHVDNDPMPMGTGSEEEFIAEHYWGYSKYSDTVTYEYQVQHPAWRVFGVKVFLVDCDFGSLYGPVFSGLSHATPHSVLVAEGSAVTVLKKRKLPD
ncbi:MAG: DUF2071 domain-containing protein [Chitinophagaceae bacterium]|nr:DUF2071 domain-containing protein [Chitinophagaceae bacterium]